MSGDTIVLSDIRSMGFEWSDQSGSTGLVAQEIESAYTTVPFNTAIGAAGPSFSGTVTMSNNTAGSYTISTPYEDMEIRLAKLEKIIAEEEEIRRSHPAVKTAYDEYRLLMILSKGTPVIPLTE